MEIVEIVEMVETVWLICLRRWSYTRVEIVEIDRAFSNHMPFFYCFYNWKAVTTA